ncbi:hypothetical protein SAMN05216206_2789 [Pseudomonas guineae]|uniref:Uncharacterized protein n=1 Tax=Pseudomonas guineae TaxID=425504 RepID=A0A1I3KDE8_9PSED|nr:hypothetical protein [Pseudomonas guineae]SFI70477.1 hypothetical protein SAMN05216206_2789 [Pseudomonas guineae]
MVVEAFEKQGIESATRPVAIAISAINARCLDAELISFSDGCRVYLDPEAMAVALSVDRPSIVFRNMEKFDPDELIRAEIISAGGRAASINRRNMVAPTAAECLKVIQSTDMVRAGQPYRVIYAYSKEGLTRACVVYAEWHAALVVLLEDFIEGHEERFEARSAREAADLVAFFRLLAEEIASDDRFALTRGLRKKGLLVEAVWGDRIPSDPQQRVTRLTPGEELQDWNFVHVVRQANDIVDQRQMLG